MNMSGTIVKETATSVLFRGGELDSVFDGREIWWPLSQVTLFHSGGAGYRADQARIITSRWIAECKAEELGRSAELAAHYADCEKLDREEREQKASRRAAKAAARDARTPEEIAAEAAAKAAQDDAKRQAAARILATQKAAAAQAVAARAAWDAMDDETRADVYRGARLPLGKNAPRWINESSVFGPRFHKSLAKRITVAGIAI